MAFFGSKQDLTITSARHKTNLINRAYHHSQDEMLSFLKQVKILSLLNEQELTQLTTQLKTVYYVHGATLIEQGTFGESMFIVVKGKAAVYIQLHDSQHCVAVLGVGQVFGEMSLMTGESRQATVIAEDDLICYELDKSNLASILEKRPELAESLADLLSQRTKELEAIEDNIHLPSQHTEKQRLLSNIRRWFGL